MAAAKATSGERTGSRSSSKLLAGALGLAIFAAAGWFFLGRGDPATTRSGVASQAGGAPVAAVPSGPVLFQVFSSAPSARVLFRGRAHQIPFAETVVADVKLELVEITAPGREGRRFWLTMDHPMQLTVDLLPGRGVIDATTEEAQIALGERTAAPAAPSLSAPPATAAEAGTFAGASSTGASSHRSSSRGKVVVAALAAAPKGGKGTTSNSAPGPTTAPSIEPPTPPPPAPSVPARATAPAPEPVVAAPPSEVVPPPAPPKAVVPAHPAPAAALVPSSALAASHVPVGGSIDSARVQQVFSQHQVDVQRCHQRAKIDNSDVRGKLNMKIAVSPSGQVTAATIESSNLHNRALEECVAAAVQSWSFPAPTGGPVTLSHQFVLR
jgi:hypothetical protein